MIVRHCATCSCSRPSRSMLSTLAILAALALSLPACEQASRDVPRAVEPAARELAAGVERLVARFPLGPRPVAVPAVIKDGVLYASQDGVRVAAIDLRGVETREIGDTARALMAQPSGESQVPGRLGARGDDPLGISASRSIPWRCLPPEACGASRAASAADEIMLARYDGTGTPAAPAAVDPAATAGAAVVAFEAKDWQALAGALLALAAWALGYYVIPREHFFATTGGKALAAGIAAALDFAVHAAASVNAIPTALGTALMTALAMAHSKPQDTGKLA